MGSSLHNSPPTVHSYQRRKNVSFLHRRALGGHRSLSYLTLPSPLPLHRGLSSVSWPSHEGFLPSWYTHHAHSGHTKTSQDSPWGPLWVHRLNKPATLLPFAVVTPLLLSSYRPALGSTTPRNKGTTPRTGVSAPSKWKVKMLVAQLSNWMNHTMDSWMQSVVKKKKTKQGGKRQEKHWGTIYSFPILPVS